MFVCVGIFVTCTLAAQSTASYYLLEDSTRQLTAEEALKQLEHRPIETTLSKNIGFTRSVFWLKVVAPVASSDSLVLSIGDAHINEIKLFGLSSAGAQLKYTTGDYYPFRQKPIPAREFLFPVEKRTQSLLRIDKSNESMQLNFEVLPIQEVLSQENFDALVMALLSGMIMLMIIFGLFLLFISRDKVYVLYVAYVSSGWLWVLAQGGYGYQYLWPNATTFTSLSRPLFSILTLSFSALFMLQYIRSDASKTVRRIIYGFCAFLWLCIPMVLFLDIRSNQNAWFLTLQKILPAISLLYVLFSLGVLLYHVWRGNKLALFYLASIGALLVFILLQIAFYTGNLHTGVFISRFGVPIGYVAEAIILTAGLVYRFNQYRKDKEQLLIDINRKEAEAVRMMMKVQETERSQIANQLHDVAGSLLSAARLNLSTLLERPYELSENQHRLKKTEEAVSMVSDTVRNLSHALSPVMLQQVGFGKSLEKVVSIFNASGKINITLVVLGFEQHEERLTNYYTALYSITYELLNNIVKHSGAGNALVQVIEHPQCFSIIVEDDGKGMSQVSPGQGLTGIHSKVNFLKGSMAVEESQPSGTMITIEIPRENNEL
jgi:two-component system, sensor histidine kinase LadS